MDTLTLDFLIEKMKPYDCHLKKDFVRLLKEFPELKADLDSSLATDAKWAEKALCGDVRFIVNDSRRKNPKPFHIQPHVVVNFIGGIPVVSLNV